MKRYLFYALLLALLASTPFEMSAQKKRKAATHTQSASKAWATLCNGVLTFTYGAKPTAPSQVPCTGCNKSIAFSTNYCPNCGHKNNSHFYVFDALVMEKVHGDDAPVWHKDKYTNLIRRVVFKPSFKQVTNITSTCQWFCNNKIESIEGLEYLNTSKVTNMKSMFAGCRRIKTLDVSHFDTANVTDMSEMFQLCESLTSLDVSHFNTANVTNMRDMFWHCENLTSLDVSHFNTVNVTDMSGMFRYCKSLTTLNLSNFNTSKVEHMQSMFAGFPGVTLDISTFDTRKAETGGMFWDSKLQTIYVSNKYWFPNDKGYYDNVTPYLKNCRAKIVTK